MSKDVVSVTTLLGSVMMLRLTFGSSANALASFRQYCFHLAQDQTLLPLPRELLFEAMVVGLRTAGPMLAIAILLSTIATMRQTRMLVTFELIRPKLEKLNPIAGFQRMFSLNSIVNALKGILEIIVLMIIIYQSVRDLIMVSGNYMYTDLLSACGHLFRAIFTMLIKVVLAFIVLAAADYLYQWWSFEKNMRMTKEEVKEEYKQTEGDPKTKSRIRSIQRQMSMSRMMKQVPKADVIIRNPTHVAVALRYHPGEDAAPVLLAKGLDFLALRIIEEAERYDIVVIENRPLARSLYANVELNQIIPPELYEAVAEVMVYLYQINRIKGPLEPTEGE